MVDQSYIQFTNVQMGYAPKHVIVRANEINLKRASLIGLVGLNGTGKSTMLRSMAGLQNVLAGEIKIGGMPLIHFERSALARKLAIVLTEKVSGFNLKVEDVVASGQMPYTDVWHQLNASQISLVQEAMKFTGVDAYAKMDMSDLSDGMRQKTMIAKALAQNTEALLLDEPSAYLDFASRHQLFQLLKQMAVEQGKCIVLSSHDLDLVLRYCDELLIIDEGLVQQVSIAEARTNRAFRKIAGDNL